MRLAIECVQLDAKLEIAVHRSSLRSLFVSLLVLALTSAAMPAAAEPLIAWTSVTPTLDGQCDTTTEYAASAGYGGILLYRPGEPHAAARIFITVDGANLYICVWKIPVNAGPPLNSVILSIDVDADGGREPRPDDIRIEVDEFGAFATYRGDVSGEYLAASLGSSAAATDYNPPAGGGAPVTWNAEFSIPRTIFGIEEAVFKGFHVYHGAHSDVLDYHIWPATADPNIPDQYEQMYVLPRPTSFAPAQLNDVRITQGLDIGILRGATQYDLVAGKDTSVFMELWASVTVSQPISEAECIAIGPTGFETRVPIPISSPLFLRNSPRNRLYSELNPRCHFQGDTTAWPGHYRFFIDIRRGFGSGTWETVYLGRGIFRATHDLNLFFWPWQRDEAGDPNTATWDSSYEDTLLSVTYEHQRVMPLRSNFRYLARGAASEPAGLGIALHPFVHECGDGDPCGAAAMAAQAETTRIHFNRFAPPGQQADYGARLEAVVDVLAAPNLGTCARGAFALCNALIEPATEGVGASAIVHSLNHPLGVVDDASPFSDGAGHSTSITTVDTPDPLVDIWRRSVGGAAIPLMRQFVSTNVRVVAHEVWDWNFARHAYVANPRAESVSPSPPSFAPSTATFHVVASLSTVDVVNLYSSHRVDDGSLPASADVPGAEYELVLLDSNAKVLVSRGFTPRFDDDPPTHAPVVMTLPWDTAATTVAVLKNGQPLFSESFSALAPSVTSLDFTLEGENLRLDWTASDADSANLRYSVYYNDAQRGTQLIQSALEDPTYLVRPLSLPASNDVTFSVEASDGLQTDAMTSPPFVVPDSDPVARIVTPEHNAELLESAVVNLRAIVADPTEGILKGPALEWDSTLDGFLGTGDVVQTNLSVGSHFVTVTATAPSTLTDSAVVQVDVLADTDGDGIGDAEEQLHACLSQSVADAAVDVDGDGLSSEQELADGSDPCDPDSDLDNYSDGEESRLGSDSLDPQSTPTPPQLFVTPTTFDLADCPTPSIAALEVQTGVNDSWFAISGQPWLSAEADSFGTAQVPVVADCSGLGAGVHRAKIYIVHDSSGQRSTAVATLFNPYQASDGIPDCDDGIDNDADGDIDLKDASCADSSGPSEVSAAFPCDNGIDDDGDGAMDFPFDRGCASPVATTEAPACQDGIDNDNDGLVDLDGGASAKGAAVSDSDLGCSEFTGASERDGAEVPLLHPLGLWALAGLLLLAAGRRLRSRA